MMVISEAKGYPCILIAKESIVFQFLRKRFEIANREKISEIEALTKYGIYNRYELRLANEKATQAVEAFILDHSLNV